MSPRNYELRENWYESHILFKDVNYIFSYFLQSFTNLNAGNLNKTALSDSRVIKVEAEKRNFLED
jgi:hypothetical protein